MMNYDCFIALHIFIYTKQLADLCLYTACFLKRFPRQQVGWIVFNKRVYTEWNRFHETSCKLVVHNWDYEIELNRYEF